jgi:hypothetical protein
MNRKKITIAGAELFAALTLAGCATQADQKITDGQVVTRTVELPSGTEVECVFWVPIDNLGKATAEGAQMQCWGIAPAVSGEQLPTLSDEEEAR